MAWSPAREALHEIQSSVDHAIGRDDSIHLDEWEEVVAEYGFAYISRPPHLLLPDVAADLVTVRTIMSRARSGDPRFPSWCRVTSGLTMMMAKTLANLGQSREARTWWVTAQHAAAASGDTNLSLWVSGEQLIHGLYERRPTPILLRQANAVVESSPQTPCRGLAPVRAARAQLLALDGQHAEAVHELHRSQDVFEQLPSAVTDRARSIACWGEDRLRYTEAWVYAYAGDRPRLDEAVARTHELLPAQHRSHTQIDLLQAFGHIQTGDVTEGIRHASTAYEAHPVDQRTTLVSSLADLVLEAVPDPRHADPAVLDYRELVAAGANRKAIT